MTDQGKSDHWDLLVSTLGAEPPQEVDSLQAPQKEPLQAEVKAEPAREAEDPLELFPKVSYTPPAPRGATTPQDWNRLASELGLELPTEPETPAPEVPAQEAPAPEEPEPATIAEIVVAEHRTMDEDAEEPPFGAEVDYLDLTQIVQPAKSPEDTSSDREEWEPPSESAEEEPRGHHRRKRRRRSARPQAEVPGERLEPEGELAPDLVVSQEFEDMLELPEEPGQAEVAEAAPSGEESPPARRRRRRHRSSGRTRPAETARAEPQGSDQGDETDEVAEEELPPQEPAAVGEEDEDDDSFDESSGDRSDKSLHRAIPNWYEAVNIVIEANMESRVKNPDRRQRGRGNRGRDNHGD
ncbi:MAG: hypothetical protein ACLQNE_30325 [Thermoguttaceae bacterium]